MVARPPRLATIVIVLPDRLASACLGHAERVAWFERLPRTIAEIAARWSLSIGSPYEEASGNPTVRLLDCDSDLNAMLLERCEPGTSLRELIEDEQDVVLAGLLIRLWRRPPSSHAFRSLSQLIAAWMQETVAAKARWCDEDLVQAGLRVFEALKDTSVDDVVLATDLHAGNVLRARREPWLVVDPKPFVGDRAYDATQHIFNCTARVLAAPHETIHRISDLLGVDRERVRLWTFARSAAEPRDAWTDDSHAIAGALA